MSVTFRVGLIDSDDYADFEGESLLVNFGLGRVAIAFQPDGSVNVNVIEDAEGTVRQLQLDRSGFRK